MTTHRIIIFTKDRPDILNKTLQSIKNKNISVIVLDDSYLIENRVNNKNKIKKYSNVIYHGKDEQQKLLKKTSIEKELLEKFTHKLGSKGWNLGYARNYAIVLARSLQLKKVLFMDDDIIVESKTLIPKIFNLLDKYDFLGAKVTGMIDDSVVGYIVRELKYPSEEYFSGGFIAFNPYNVTEYFINRYNEDWIWMYLHHFKYSFHLYGSVRQLPFDNFKNAINKAKKQEVGEILVDGIKECFTRRNIIQLRKTQFWKRVLLEKQLYYKELKTLSLQSNNLNLYAILSSAATYSSKLKPQMFSLIMNEYFNERQKWIKILKSL